MRNTFSIAATAVAFAVFLGFGVIISSNARSLVVPADLSDADYMLDTINDWSWARGLSANEF